MGSAKTEFGREMNLGYCGREGATVMGKDEGQTNTQGSAWGK